MTHNIFRPSAAAQYLGISRATLYRLVAEGVLPPPTKIGERASGWRKAVLDDYVDACPPARIRVREREK